MASWRSKVTPCPQPRPHSRREGTSPRRLSRTSTSALSTGLWCSGSAACCRSAWRLISNRISCEIGSSTHGHCSVFSPLLFIRASCCAAPVLWCGITPSQTAETKLVHLWTSCLSPLPAYQCLEETLPLHSRYLELNNKGHLYPHKYFLYTYFRWKHCKHDR